MTASMAAGIEPADVLTLRREIYANPSVSRADLTRLLTLSRAAGAAASAQFAELLAEVATDLMVRQVDPPKYITGAHADWLIAELGRGDSLSCRAEYKMLAEMLRYAVSAPPALVAFIVRDVEERIVKGHGADHPVGKVTKDDLDVLRTAVFAGAEGSALHVSRDSAEALFRIAQSTAGADNDPGFDDFFAKAVGNYLMGIAFHWTPSVDDELRKEKWLEAKPEGVEGFLSAMLRGDRSDDDIDMMASVGEIQEARIRLANEADAREMVIGSEIDPNETDWLLAHLTREGALTSAERSLLSFLKAEAPSMPPSLLALIEKQAA